MHKLVYEVENLKKKKKKTCLSWPVNMSSLSSFFNKKANGSFTEV